MDDIRDMSEYVEHYARMLSGPCAEDSWHSLLDAGPSALPFVVEAFQLARDPIVRVSLVQVLGEYRSHAAVAFLAGLLINDEPQIWKTALDGLVTLGGDEALKVLAAAKAAATPEKRAWYDEAVQQITDNLTSSSSESSANTDRGGAGEPNQHRSQADPAADAK